MNNHFIIFRYCTAVILCLFLQSFYLNNRYFISDNSEAGRNFGTPLNLTGQCSPISSLDCPALVKNLPFNLNFTGSEGGLQDKNRVATGFTMVDKPSAPLVTPTYANIPGYEPSKLQISAGKLIITTTAGSSYLNPAQSAKTNSQVNALGAGFVSPSKFTIQSTLVQPAAGSGKSEQAGLWFGLDEDNFVKLVVLSAGGGTSKLEMRKEIAAISSTADVKSTGSMTLSSSLVKLKFLVDKVASTIEGSYSINGGAEIKIGTLSIPQSFTTGKTLSDGLTKNITFAGIFATHRTAATALNYKFEDFKIEQAAVKNFSLKFNGTNRYVNLYNDSSLSLTRFTLEAWIRPEGAGVTTTSGAGGVIAVPIINKGRAEADAPATVNVNYFLGIGNNKKLCADFEKGSGTNYPVVSNTAIKDSVWTHVAVTYEPVSAVWKLYINGVLDIIKDLGSNITPANTSIQPAAIATAFNSMGVPEGYFKGNIDEVRIWNVVRTDAEILKNYPVELTRGTGLVARYGLNEGTISIAVNSIQKTSNGTLVNNPQWSTGFNQTVRVNSSPNTPVNPSPANGASSSTSVTLCTTVSDPDNDRLKVRYYGRKKATNGKSTLIIIPDTQYYTAEKNSGNNEMFKAQTRWIANNRATKNIVYVGHLGDCTENGDFLEIEWKRADTAMKTIENPTLTGLVQGVPYGICVGNHDQKPNGDPNGTTIFFNKYFGISRFNGRSYYGGHSGTNNDNNYQLFSASGINFLVISVEYDLTTNFTKPGGALDWAEGIIKSYPNRKVIVMTHFALNGDVTFSSQGKALYNRLKIYPNFLLMIGGHIAAYTGESRRTDTYSGHTVHSVASDYQDRTNAGNGLMRIYEFDPSINNVAVKTYSPYTNQYETDASSQFNLTINLNSNSYTLIGEATNISSGNKACINWSSLQQNTAYEWYAEVFDGYSTTTGPVWSFTTNAYGSSTLMTKVDLHDVDNLTDSSSTAGIQTVNNTNTDIAKSPVNSHPDSEKLNVKLGPNPSGNILTVYINGLPMNKDLRISILSISGTVLKTMQYNTSYKPVQVNVSTLKSGVYLLQVASGETQVFKRFIKY